MKIATWSAPGIVLVVVGALACSDETGGSVTLSLSTREAPPLMMRATLAVSQAGGPAVVLAGDSTVIVLGNDMIILRSVELVLRKIELKRVDATSCDDVIGNEDCEEFETSPVLLSVPLGATATTTVVAVNAPAGLYDELEFKIHKPEPPEDAPFIAVHPTWNGVSIRVSGTYSQAGTRSDFAFTSDLNASQEILLSPALTVSDGAATNVTLRLNVATWFLNVGATALVNPNTANKGQPNEMAVRDRIQASIDAFRDNDRDGHDDDNPVS